MRNKPLSDQVSDDDKRAICNDWLDGHSLASIKELRADHLSIPIIKRVLDAGPPDFMADDPRLEGRRYFWMAVRGVKNPVTGEWDPFVVIRRPRRLTVPALRRATSSIRRGLRDIHPGAELVHNVSEGFEAHEAHIAERRIKNGCLGWAFDEKGGECGTARSHAPASEPACADNRG